MPRGVQALLARVAIVFACEEASASRALTNGSGCLLSRRTTFSTASSNGARASARGTSPSTRAHHPAGRRAKYTAASRAREKRRGGGREKRITSNWRDGDRKRPASPLERVGMLAERKTLRRLRKRGRRRPKILAAVANAEHRRRVVDGKHAEGIPETATRASIEDRVLQSGVEGAKLWRAARSSLALAFWRREGGGGGNKLTGRDPLCSWEQKLY